MIGTLLDYIFPPKCVFCGELLAPGTLVRICEECNHSLHISEDICAKCHAPLKLTGELPGCPTCIGVKRYYHGAIGIYRYAGNVASAMKRFKFTGKTSYAKTFAYELARSLRLIGACAPLIDVVTYIPSDKRRQSERGYNPSFLLAQAIANMLNLPLMHTLDKKKSIKPQSSLSKEQRKANIRGAFALTKGAELSGKRILLIDDVFTTGSTVGEAARVLRRGGAAYVFAAAVASANMQG